jgi:N-acetylmuramoyl-L-alanine amidase
MGCPNVGWSYLLDTTSMADGAHTLTITANGTVKQSSSTKITVANGNAKGPSFRVYIDQPGANSSTLRGGTLVSGWAIVTSGAQPAIKVYIDDVLGDTIQFFDTRPDVCAIFLTAIGCPTVGWSTRLDTTQYLDGAHTLRVVANSGTLGTGFATMPITIGNSTASDPMHLAIDSSGGNLSGLANLWGWAVSDDAAIATVAVSIDGAALGNATYGDGRADVCAAYQNRKGCPNVGWHLPVDTTKLADGPHTVSVTATSRLAEQATQTTIVIVKN